MKIILGISGASGFIFGKYTLDLLLRANVETHVVITRAAEKTMTLESSLNKEIIFNRASKVYEIDDIGAAISSGSFKTDGMIIAPCSVRTLAAIATGNSDNLLTRAADVTLKERRKLILMVREAPFNLIHLRNMLTVTEMGGIICPPVPSFYHKPENIDEVISFTVARALDLLGVETIIKRWS